MKPGTFLHILFPLGVTIAPIQNSSLIHAKLLDAIICDFHWCVLCVLGGATKCVPDVCLDMSETPTGPVIL